jgi:hypothetical protein
MNMHSMTLDQLRTTHETGGLTAVTIRAQGNAFFIVADFRSGGQVVLVRYSDRKPRQFVDPGTALKLVRSIGFGSATVDMIDWQPDQQQTKL